VVGFISNKEKRIFALNEYSANKSRTRKLGIEVFLGKSFKISAPIDKPCNLNKQDWFLLFTAIEIHWSIIYVVSGMKLLPAIIWWNVYTNYKYFPLPHCAREKCLFIVSAGRCSMSLYVCIRYGLYVSLLRATPVIMKFPLVNAKAFAFMKHKAHNFFIQKHTQWEKCNTQAYRGISWVCNPSTLRTRRLHTDAWRMISLDVSRIAWILLTPRPHQTTYACYQQSIMESVSPWVFRCRQPGLTFLCDNRIKVSAAWAPQ